MTIGKKLFFVIWSLGLLSVLAILPYLFEVQAEVLATAPFPPPVIALLSIVQSAILLFIATALGLLLARKVGFTFPVLELLLSGKSATIHWKHVMALPVVLGMITGLLIYSGDYIFASFGVVIDNSDATSVHMWKKFLASFYGGIAEEILLRLFLVSLFVWLLAKITRRLDPLSHNWLVWTSIIAAAVLFGIGHLPATALMTALTPLVIARAIALNGVAGLIFGWLYWKRGIESAMIAHFCTDIMILIVIPSLLLN